MLEDKLLIWRLKHGSRHALCRIYEKYRDDMLRIAAGLLKEKDCVMARRKHELVADIAATCETLFNEGVYDPSLDEMLAQYYGDRLVGDGAYEDFQTCLARVRVELEQRGHHVMLVSRPYYDVHNRICPDDPAGCRSCLPLGSCSAGIRTGPCRSVREVAGR